MPISSRMVSALCSMVSSPSSERMSNTGMRRTIQGAATTADRARASRRPSRPPVRPRALALASLI